MEYEWGFTQTKPHGWIWRRLDKATGSVTQMSDKVFPLLYDCVEDAKRHGFIPSPVRLSDQGSSSAMLATGTPPVQSPG